VDELSNRIGLASSIAEGLEHPTIDALTKSTREGEALRRLEGDGRQNVSVLRGQLDRDRNGTPTRPMNKRR